MSIQVEVSLGEFLDKLTILQIKADRITDPVKLKNVNNELDALLKTWGQSPFSKSDIDKELEELRSLNEKLWDIEDDIREEEAKKNFADKFIELARSVYVTNDQRADIKKRINQKLGSGLIEEKSYSDYTGEQGG